MNINKNNNIRQINNFFSLELDNLVIDITINNYFLYNYLNEIIKKRIINKIIYEVKLLIPTYSSKQNLYLSVMITNDKEIQLYNKTYRNKTDLLMFYLSLIVFSGEKIKNGEFINLGDIVISIDTITKEAKFQSKKIMDHFLHLLLHGILHLIGFNHEKNTEAQKMETLEIKILKKLEY